MKILTAHLCLLIMGLGLPAFALPTSYTELNDYVVTAPNQGQVNTCLFMAATGAMEILLNKKLGIRNPEMNGPTDISERYTISEKFSGDRGSWFEEAFLKFNSGEAVLNRDMPFESFDTEGEINYSVWNRPANFFSAPRIALPAVETVYLFSHDKYSKGVLKQEHLKHVKESLVKYQSPILSVGNDEDYWHVTVIVGYDDDLEGDCYELDSKVCEGKKGSFYVRDSFGTRIEARSYEWFIRRQNSAAVAKLAE
jgi:hypothetical protein